MGRPAQIDDNELLSRLGGVFREIGYAGASLADLSEATGLKKASLYHRFPLGKEQMAKEVLASAQRWLIENILIPLKEDRSPEDRINAVVRRLNEFYSGGKQACLFNLLSSAHTYGGPFTKEIKATFKAFIEGLRDFLLETGLDEEIAYLRAERTVTLIHGSLVLSRGTGSTKPFRNVLKSLPAELLGS